MRERICLHLSVVIDPGLAGFADAAEGLANSSIAVVVDAALGFVVQLVDLPR